ncbi:hypothetical protein SAMN04488126_12220 [Bhargavaea beijingensis]|uniref:Uncharacterized protein n=1 Tax=Bhargavaea beijingensis TaxID=426756 RepID=A0A1G7FYR5_9BACL|nr:hypothetical protein [Bhargavaea beijingensis]SDE81036.1 hypothetical protein SAMN04488126_12220 [Bhargavaea beijingensis]
MKKPSGCNRMAQRTVQLRPARNKDHPENDLTYRAANSAGGHFLFVDSIIATHSAAKVTANISASYMDKGLTPSRGEWADHPLQTVSLSIKFNMPKTIRPCSGRIIFGQGLFLMIF